MAHLPSIVGDVAERLAASWTGAAQGNTLVVSSPTGHTLTVRCRNTADAQSLLDAATTQCEDAAYDPIRERVAAAQGKAAVTNMATLLHTRNRWLVETDTYVLPVDALPADMPNEVKAVLAAQGTPTVQQRIETWRAELRAYPATVTDWTTPPPLPSPPDIRLPSGRALIIVT